MRREVVRVVTPGTQLEAHAVEAGESAFVVALAPGPTSLGAAWLDATTGEFFVAECTGGLRWDALRDELAAVRPREILAPHGMERPPWLSDPLAEGAIPRSEIDDRWIDPRAARQHLLGHFGVVTLEAFGCEGLPQATAAGGAVLRYVRETQKRDLTHVTGLTLRARTDGLVMDALTRRNLELIENLADGGREGTLLSVLDLSETAMGSRRVRDWLLRPLARLEEIQDRLDAVEELAFRTRERGRAARGAAAGAGRRPHRGPGHARHRQPARPGGPRALDPRGAGAPRRRSTRWRAPLLRREAKTLDPPTDVAADIEATLVDEPPASVKDGGLIREGVDPELDELQGHQPRRPLHDRGHRGARARSAPASRR